MRSVGRPAVPDAMTLTPDETEALIVIRRALDEDLRYGPDVTTVARCPPTRSPKPPWSPGKAGCRRRGRGLMVLDEVLGPDGYRVLDRVEDGTT